MRQATADARGQWSLSLPVNKGENHFTIIGTDPETARRSEPLKVIATVPILGTEVAPGDEGPALPEGVYDVSLRNKDASDTFAGGYIAYDPASVAKDILGVTPNRYIAG